MAVSVESLVSAALKHAYREDQFRRQVYMGVVLLDLITSLRPQPFGASGLEHLVELEPYAGFGARSDGSRLPKGYPALRKPSYIEKRRIYATAVWDKLLAHQFKQGARSWVTEIMEQIKGVAKITRWHMNRMAHHDGTGVLFKASGGQTGPTLNIAHPKGYTYGQTQFAMERQLVVWLTIDGSGNATNPRPRRITGRSWDNGTVTFDQSVTVLDNDVCVLGDDQGHSYNNEYVGLDGLIGTGSVQGIDGATYPRWQSYIRTLPAGTTYDPEFIFELIAATLSGDEDGKVDDLVMLWHQVMLKEHRKYHQDKVLYEPRDYNFNRGQRTPVFEYDGQTVAIKTTLWQGYEQIDCFSKKAIVHAPLKEMDWDTDGGKVKQLPGTDYAFSYMSGYGNFGLNVRRCTGRLSGISIDRDHLKAIQARQ